MRRFWKWVANTAGSVLKSASLRAEGRTPMPRGALDVIVYPSGCDIMLMVREPGEAPGNVFGGRKAAILRAIDLAQKAQEMGCGNPDCPDCYPDGPPAPMSRPAVH